MNCEFKGCFATDFTNLNAIYWSDYNGDPKTSDFIIQSGTPTIQNRILKLPLLPSDSIQSTATVISTTRFLNYGIIEVKLKAPLKSSVVTAIQLFSNQQDELDFELVARRNTFNKVETNWYSKGNASYNVNLIVHTLNTDMNQDHVYTIIWTSESITWFVDGIQANKLEKSRIDPTMFPNTPMRLAIGIWQGIDNVWAGPNDVDWSRDTDISAYVQYIVVAASDCDFKVNDPTFGQKVQTSGNKNDHGWFWRMIWVLGCIVVM